MNDPASFPDLSKYSPLPWSNYFQTCKDLVINSSQTFRVYEITPSRKDSAPISSIPLFLFHHGGGHSALSWACTVEKMSAAFPGEFAALCFDARGHGTVFFSFSFFWEERERGGKKEGGWEKFSLAYKEAYG